MIDKTMRVGVLWRIEDEGESEQKKYFWIYFGGRHILNKKLIAMRRSCLFWKVALCCLEWTVACSMLEDMNLSESKHSKGLLIGWIVVLISTHTASARKTQALRKPTSVICVCRNQVVVGLVQSVAALIKKPRDSGETTNTKENGYLALKSPIGICCQVSRIQIPSNLIS
jgi:hypothetical protein